MLEMDISFPGGMRVDTRFKGFTVSTDQPRDEGGDNSAPEPYDIFVASLATCAGVYVVSFCQERSIPTQDLKMRLTAEKNEQTKLYEKITLFISLPAEFPDKYVRAVQKAAGLCTVKRSLSAPPEFETVIQNDLSV